jgi:hypothetical protein
MTREELDAARVAEAEAESEAANPNLTGRPRLLDVAGRAARLAREKWKPDRPVVQSRLAVADALDEAGLPAEATKVRNGQIGQIDAGMRFIVQRMIQAARKGYERGLQAQRTSEDE